jgi:hypothetical protein
MGKLNIGQLLLTPGVIDLKDDTFIFKSLSRHANGDWGNVCEDDWKENDFSINNSLRILSSYTNDKGNKIWIITEANRSVTTVLLPEEY